MSRKTVPYICLALTVLIAALLLPAAGGVRIEPKRLTAAPAVTSSPTPSPTPAPTPTPIPVPEEYVLRSESNAREMLEDVKAIQARLRQLGFYTGEADGYYGRSTFEAVYNFQRINGLNTDGIAGENTQRMLFEDENVKNSLGRVYVPYVSPSPSPVPTPTPAPEGLPMDSFVSGAKPIESLFGGDVYRDGTIRASVEKENGILKVYVKIANAYQLRSALAGTYALPQTLDISRLAEVNDAVVAFAGSDYRLSDDYELRQQLPLKEDISESRPLLCVDTEGNLHIYAPTQAAEALGRAEGRFTQVLTVPRALIINGILPTGLNQTESGQLLAFGQTGEKSYLLVCASVSESALAGILQAEGCKNAAVVGNGGVYTCFGSETVSSLERQEAASNILYFASCYEGVTSR